jgi:hypothetical protein
MMSKEFKINTCHVCMTHPFVVPHKNLRGTRKNKQNTHKSMSETADKRCYYLSLWLTSGQKHTYRISHDTMSVYSQSTNLSVKVVDSSSGFVFDRDYDVHRLPCVDHHVPRIAVKAVGPVVVTLLLMLLLLLSTGVSHFVAAIFNFLL